MKTCHISGYGKSAGVHGGYENANNTEEYNSDFEY